MVLSIGQEVEALHAFLMHFLDSNVGHTFGIELEVGGLAVVGGRIISDLAIFFAIQKAQQKIFPAASSRRTSRLKKYV